MKKRRKKKEKKREKTKHLRGYLNTGYICEGTSEGKRLLQYSLSIIMLHRFNTTTTTQVTRSMTKKKKKAKNLFYKEAYIKRASGVCVYKLNNSNNVTMKA